MLATIKTDSLSVIGTVAPIVGSILLNVEIWLRVVGFTLGIAVGILTLILKIKELRR